ncbi:trimeric intracellular cation channel family protein [Micromonospora sp. DT233]|uniref:trimeric intracellular cation channel family protein n=1 Tax=Micromonospora sp. DT233 TaxID=3393432 RepID=UPI003CF1CBD2
MTTSTALLIADLTGVAVFAASGASAAVAKRLDLFGVAFVGFVAALGGGIFRDLAIGEAPPLAFADWRYVAAAGLCAAAVFWLHPQLARLRTTVLVLDAAGLALFTVAGTLKALDAQVPAVGACLIGMLTAIGGGLARDLLTGEIPVVLRREIYAVAALLGSIGVAVLDAIDHADAVGLTAVAVGVFALRLVSLRRRWSAPVATMPPPGTGTPGPGTARDAAAHGCAPVNGGNAGDPPAFLPRVSG